MLNIPTNETNLRNPADLTSPTDNLPTGPITNGDFSNWREPESEKDKDELPSMTMPLVWERALAHSLVVHLR